jgi:septum formation protein
MLARGDVSPAHWVAALAYLKAWAGTQLPDASDCCVVLGADTTCVKGERMIGTPADETQARAMLRDLSDSEHEVITGVAIIDRRVPRGVIFTDSATVHVGALSDSMIDQYVAGGGWRGKAGGYNLSERMDAGWPIRFVGDQTTVMGLPMGALVPILRSLAKPGAALR